MESTAIWELQQALFKRLSEIGLPVYDQVPKNAVFPYIVIGSPQAIPFDTHVSKGEKISVVIHAWSNYPGKKEAMMCLKKALEFLSYKAIKLDDLSLFEFRRARHTNIEVFDDIDGYTKHGVVHVEAFIEF